MTSLGNVWDANETWLVLMGGALFGAFRLAYGTILKALYGPINLMILGLILGGWHSSSARTPPTSAPGT
jgi:cytochrome d ubiquinol oxidase subunit II